MLLIPIILALATADRPVLIAAHRGGYEFGPENTLEGIKGIIVRSKGVDRLIVMVTLLTRSVSVEIDRRWVKPIKPHRPTVHRQHELVCS